MSAKTKKAVWVDLLCWESAFKIMVYARTTPVEKIHYINVTRSFKRFVPWLEQKTGVACVCADNIVEGELKWQGMSLYEMIQTRLTDILGIWTKEKNVKRFLADFCAANNYNPDKFEAHLQEAAYPYIFRAVEISVLAEHIYGPGNCVLILRRTPLKRLLKLFLGVKDLHFYRTWISQRRTIETRPDYYYDRHCNAVYFGDRFAVIGKFVGIWLFNALGAVLNWRPVNSDRSAVAIGLELTQSRQRPDAINDVAWLEASGIDPKNVHALEFGNSDEESIKYMRSLGIRRYKVIQFPSQLLQRLKTIERDSEVSCVTAPAAFAPATVLRVLTLLRSLLVWNEKAWLRLQATKYACRVKFWQMIYERLGIRILWSMFDIDEDKLAKAQAIELLGGFSAGSHWSNFPMYRVDNQKCLDVIVTWGEHFIKNNFQRSPFMAIFLVGYPCDYYFKMHREGAKAIRQRHEGKFILSYHDNIMANDLPYSKGMQLEIHQMLLSILKKFEDVVILLKPKRRFVIDDIFVSLPELAHYLREGRLEVFMGDTSRTKAVPAEIGMASDLVIGLGISTTAAEAYFAGTVAFHAEFTGFERNEFGNRGLGVIVFRDIFTLEKAVIERIQGKNKISHEEYHGYYTSLDPFQDGCGAKRTGFILKRMREYLAQGMDRYVLLGKVKSDYDVYLSSMKNLQGMSLN